MRIPQTLLTLALLLPFTGAGTSASSIPVEGCDRWLAHRARQGVPAHPHACFQKEQHRLDVLVLPRAHSLEPGADFEADVVVWFGEAVEAVRVEVTGSGRLDSATSSFELRGPWAAGETADFTLTASPSEGEGAVRVDVLALGRDDEVVSGAAAELFARYEGDDVWISHLGTADLRLQRLRDLEARGALDASAADGAWRAAVGSRVEDDATPHRPAVATPLQKRLDRVYRDAGEALGADGDGIGAFGAGDITIEGHVQWTDAENGRHDVPQVTVEIWDEESVLDELLATTMTDASGRYRVAISDDDGVGGGTPDVYVRALARSPVAEISPDLSSGNTYFIETLARANLPSGSTQTFNLVASRSLDNETAFGVHAGLILIGAYTASLTGSLPSQFPVKFPSDGSNVTTSGGTAIMNLLRLDRFDWDVLHHEYGHYVSSANRIDRSPGGDHGGGQNLWTRYGDKSKGILLAWGEGWPTFFGTAGQISMGAAALGIPNVGDSRYTDTEEPGAVDYSLESAVGKGEDNERSVSVFLWDLFDGAPDGFDELSMSDGLIFNRLRSARAVTLGDAWEAIAKSEDTERRAVMGGILAWAGVAPEQTAPADGFGASGTSSPPAFKWLKNGAGPANRLDDFKIVFYTNDFEEVIFEKLLGDVSSWIPSQAEWTTILAGDGVVNWVVEGKNTSAPETPGGPIERYWSKARSIGTVDVVFVIDDTASMSEEIDGVKAALQAYIDLVESELPTDRPAPTIQLITFKDEVVTRIVSNNLDAVRAEVDALVAEGGEGCPEFSAHALLQASRDVSPAGTVIIATDAASQGGVSVGEIVANLRGKFVTVDTILSGDCSDIGPASADPNRLASSGAQQKSARGITPQKEGEDEPKRDPIDDPGQEPFDEHADTSVGATRIVVGAPAVRGVVGQESDVFDWFVVGLEAGRSYSVSYQLDDGDRPLPEITFYDLDASTKLVNEALAHRSLKQFVFEPEESGDYFIRISGFSPDSLSTYLVRVVDDPFAGFLDSGLELFSTVAAETGGSFTVRDDVNAGASEAYVSAMFNVMAGSLGPAVLSGNPSGLPRGTTVSVALTGRNTNWQAGSRVSFSGGGLSVKSVDVLSATSLTALVEVGSGAGRSFRDVQVETPLGAEVEIAKGRDVVEVVKELTEPTALSVEPFTLTRAETSTLLVRGVNTSWRSQSQVSFADFLGGGSGVDVLEVDVLSDGLIEVEVAVDDEARLGFRSASVRTGGETLTRERAVRVQSNEVGIAQLESIFPTSVERGEMRVLMVEGANTHFEEGLTTASLGDDIGVAGVTVGGPTAANVMIEVAADASIGFRNVVLQTGSETAVLLDGLLVAGAFDPVVSLPANGKFLGCVGPGEEALFEFGAPVNRAIKSLSLAGRADDGTGQGKLIGEVSLIDPLGGETLLAKMKASGKKAGKKAKASSIRLTLAGTYALAVRGVDGRGGCFKGKAVIEPTQGSIPLDGCLATAQTWALPFSVLPGSAITKLSVEGSKKKGRSPQPALDPLVELEAPSGAIRVLDQTAKRKVVLKGETLGESGDYELRVGPVAGGAGCFEGKLKLRQGPDS